MPDKNLGELIQELLTEESVELDLMKIYNALIDLGVEKCVAKDKQGEMRRGMRKLYEESVKHKEIIDKILNNHKYAQKLPDGKEGFVI